MTALAVGDRRGRLVLLRTYRGDRSRLRGEFRCDCGNLHDCRVDGVTRGAVKSCGCFHDEVTAARTRRHGHTANAARSPTFETWRGMRFRCYDPTCYSFQYYGARGVTVCERWQSFDAFLADMGERPPGMTLDRIDPSGNYEPSNCRWATRQQQDANRRRA